VLTALCVVAVACAPAAPSPTAPPAKPTEAPKPALSKAEGPAATAAPAKPAEAPAAKPAATAAPAKAEAKPAASPAAKAEAQPAASPAAKPAASPAVAASPKPAVKLDDIRVLKPSGNLALKLGHPAAVSFSSMPLVITHERLNTEGWKIEDVTFAQSGLNAEALSKGDVQVANGLPVSFMNGVAKGGKMTWVADHIMNEWVVVAAPEVRSCDDLNGKRVAIHAEGSTATAMIRTWIASTCKAAPNYLVIAGGENRSRALMNGQIEATPLQFSDWVNIQTLAPDKYKLLVNFAQGLAHLTGSGLFMNTDWVAANREVAVAYVAELLKTNRMVAQDPKLIEEATTKHVPDMDPKAIPPTVRVYNEIGAFPPNGGINAEKIDGTIKFYEGASGLEKGLTVEKVANLKILEDALKIVGMVPGKP
jgi:ABC-type nitrate/sulfonate/bicarbonate transport system substrate-binding protein